jgi:hypothetical protein
MEKQITTVYVPTSERYINILNSVSEKGEIVKQQAYIYTPKEHAAVQGYIDTLLEIATCKRKKWYDILSDYFAKIANEALSKEEDKGEGVIKGEELFNLEQELDIPSNLRWHNSKPTTQPTNSLDELERWVKNLEKNQRFFTIILSDDILAKIQELKHITSNNGWISVEDRLPEVGEWYLVNTTKRGVIESFYDSKDLWLTIQGDLRENETITHWQPKPTPPKL